MMSLQVQMEQDEIGSNQEKTTILLTTDWHNVHAATRSFLMDNLNVLDSVCSEFYKYHATLQKQAKPCWFSEAFIHKLTLCD